MHALVAIYQEGRKKSLIACHSESILMSIKYPDIKGKFHSLIYLIKDIQNLLDKNYNIVLIRILGHSQISGNESADLLAKKAASNIDITDSYKEISFTED